MTKTIETTEIKAAHTQYNVASFITERFSPRAFSEKSISEDVRCIRFCQIRLR